MIPSPETQACIWMHDAKPVMFVEDWAQRIRERDAEVVLAVLDLLEAQLKQDSERDGNAHAAYWTRLRIANMRRAHQLGPGTE